MPSFFRSRRRPAPEGFPDPSSPRSGAASTGAPAPEEVTSILLAHLQGRRVAGVRADGSRWSDTDTVDDAATLARAASAGVVGWLDLGAQDALTSGRAGVRVTVGGGTHLATAATAVLALLEDLAADGVPAVATTGGPGTIWVLLAVPGSSGGSAGVVADGAVRRLVAARPESVTTDTAQADGRAVAVVADGRGDRWPPVPYSSVPPDPDTSMWEPGAHAPDDPIDDLDEAWDGSAAVIPLHQDEIAAVTAGMPLTVGVVDVPERLRRRGDLAAVLR